MDDEYIEFERYKNKRNKKRKKKRNTEEKNSRYCVITIDDLIDPDTNLTDIQRVMKRNRELLLIIENLKKIN